jgi:hemolysin activation/secretion protein
MSFNANQSVSFSGSDDGTRTAGTGFGGSLSGSVRGIKGTSFASVSGSQSYSVTSTQDDEDIKLESQFVNANLSRNQTLNRLSAFTANMTAQWRRQLASDQAESTSRTANASLSYRHQRFFGVYALYYDSIAAYNMVFNPGEDRRTTMYWRNTWRYTIGLLDLSLFMDFARDGDSPTRGSVRFRATRSF